MTLELTTLSSLRDTIVRWREAGETIAMVPTMGALHRGHMTLVECARGRASRVVVSIFVNPTQFGPNEDFSRYPRSLEQDVKLLQEEGVDAAWLPDVAEMYPDGFATSVQVKGISETLEGVHRPGHFDGVATVVSKLLLQVTPDIALFGEKDYQQLCVIRRMVRDLNIPVRIEGVPTVREASGLALSSRNQYLSVVEHEVAPKLYAVMQQVAAQLKHGDAVTPDDSVEMVLERAKSKLLAVGFTRIDYLAFCEGESLKPLHQPHANARLLAAAWLGKTRLIDNIVVE